MPKIRQTRIPEHVWETHKAQIKRLYLEEDKVLEGREGVIAYMQENFAFHASKAQYETKFRRWGFRKNLTKEGWQVIANILHDRRSQKLPTQVFYYGKELSSEKIQKETKRYRNHEDSVCFHSLDRLPDGVTIEAPMEEQEQEEQKEIEEITSEVEDFDGLSLIMAGTMETFNYTSPGFGMSSSFPMVTSFAHTTLGFDSPSPKLGFPCSSAFDSNVSWSSPMISLSDWQFLGTPPPPTPRSLSTSTSTLHEEIPQNTMSLIVKINIPIPEKNTLSRHRDIPEAMRIHLARSSHVVPLQAVNSLQRAQPDLAFIRLIAFLCMNNLADDLMDESIFGRIRHFTMLQAKTLIETIPSPYSEALLRSILSIAIKSGAISIVQASMRYKRLDMNMGLFKVRGKPCTAIHLACAHLQIDIVRILLRYGALPDGYGATTILEFTMPGNTLSRLPDPRDLTIAFDILDLLLKEGAEITTIDLASYQHSTLWGNSRFVDLFIEHFKPHDNKETLIHGLIEGIILPKIQSEDQATRFLAKVLRQHLPITAKSSVDLQKLLENNCVIAMQTGRHRIAEWLSLSGHQHTPECMIAAIGGSPALVPSLLKSGLDFDASSEFVDGQNDGVRILKPRSYTGTHFNVIEPLLLEELESPKEGFISALGEAIRCRQTSLIPGPYLRLEHTPLRVLSNALGAACEIGDAEFVDRILVAIKRISRSSFDFDEISIAYATIGGHEGIVHTLLEAGVKPQCSSIACAIAVRNFSLLKLFLDTATSLFESRSFGIHLSERIAWLAARWGESAAMKFVIDAGASLSQPVWSSKIRFLYSARSWVVCTPTFPLGEAMMLNHEAVVDTLLTSVPTLSFLQVEDHWNRETTALAQAVLSGSQQFVDKILAHGADPRDPFAIKEAAKVSPAMVDSILTAFDHRYRSPRPSVGWLALREAICNNELAQVRLFAKYTSLNQPEHQSKRIRSVRHTTDATLWATPLWIAIQTDNYDIVSILLALGASANGTVSLGHPRTQRERLSALLHAIMSGNLDIVRLICKAGADVNFPIGLGIMRTPLQMAAEKGNLEIVQFLLDQGAKVNAEPCLMDGGTALQLAAMKGFVRVAELLIKYGANVNAERGRYQGRTAFEGAAEHGRMDMLLLLHHNNVDLISDPAQVSNAIDLAVRNGHPAVKMLIEQLARASKDAFIDGWDSNAFVDIDWSLA